MMHTNEPRMFKGSLLLAAALLLLSPPVLTACGGGSSGGSDEADLVAPATFVYAVQDGRYRANEAIQDNTVTAAPGGGAATYNIDPPLPGGMAIDPATGTISGTPTAEAPETVHTVSATNAAGSVQATVQIVVGPALPAAFEMLAEGFVAEQVAGGGLKIAKMVVAPDGRIFFTEVDSGQIRVIHPNQGLLPTPWATVTVTNGGHQGLLGLVLAPDFGQSGYVYVMATVPGANQGDPTTTSILRFTDDPVNNVGTNEVAKVTGLPTANINNGGELVFAQDGTLFVSVGDVEVPANSQADAATSLAGKVLRYDVLDGGNPDAAATIPADNPYTGSPEWCRGLRNTFGMARHPTTGGLFGADNGPASDDELNFLEAGKNFEWGAVTPVAPSEAGSRIQVWPTVIVPTALAWHEGTTWGAAYANNLFLTSYDDQAIRRFEMEGSQFNQIDSESEWARFGISGNDNKPLDIEIDPLTGDMYVATFTAIWRIRKL